MNDLIFKVWCHLRQRNIQHFLIEFWSVRKVVFHRRVSDGSISVGFLLAYSNYNKDIGLARRIRYLPTLGRRSGPGPHSFLTSLNGARPGGRSDGRFCSRSGSAFLRPRLGSPEAILRELVGEITRADVRSVFCGEPRQAIRVRSLRPH